MATIEELEIAGATAFANNDLDAAQYFADEIKALQSANVDSEESLLDTTKVLADDFSNQFNNSIATLAGAPVDLIAFGLNKASNAIFDENIVAPDSFGGSESIRRGLQFLSFGVPVRDEPARTRAGLVGQVAGETVGFTIPALKAAQVASKTQATTKAGDIGVNLAKQFTDEATKNTGRFLAVESGAVAGASGGRILSEEKDLSPGAAVAVEVLTGLTGALAGDKTFGVSKALINKSKGKTAQEIMESVAKGEITEQDLKLIPRAEETEISLAPFDEGRAEIALNLLSKQRTQLAADAGNLNNYAPGSNKKPTRLFNRINSWLAPSKVVGRGILNEIEQAKGIIREAESVGIRTYNAVERIKKANPDNAAAIDKNVNDFLLGGELDPLLVPIRTELSAWRTSTNKLQERLIGAMDDQAFMDLSPEIREGLRRAIEDSMEDNAGYLTTPYRLFEDPDYKPTKQQEDAAFKEIQLNLMESGVPSVKASELARKKINDLKGNSAKTRELESNRGIRPVASESILRQRTFPGPAERAWLGEITEGGQRALMTSRRLSRLASAKAEDAEIANLLLDSGVATRTAREGTVELKLKTVSGNTNIYVNPEVADSIYKLRYGQMVNQGVRNIGAKLLDAFFTANFFAKFTKVILNVGSYPVAALGAITSTLSNAAIPNFSGLRKAAAGFRSLENFVAGKTPDAKKKFYAELDKMDLYNLRPKSVDAADMEATLKRGFRIFDKFLSAQKVIDIGGKAYSAADVALRYTTWKATQKQLAKVFPDYTTEQIEAAAARMVNDTFPNYDKLSDVVRAGSRLILQPFIAHFAELSRVSYNQGKFALQMLRGNFGRDFGLDPARANKSAMRILGTKRLTAFAAFTAGTKVLINQKNEESGLDDNSVQAFKQSVLPPWMEATTPIIKPNKDNPRRGFFVPPEYLIPQLAMADSFGAAINGQPFERVHASILKRTESFQKEDR